MRKYFKYLHLVREDIREEIDLLGIPQNQRRICDYGCGNGLTTFGLALEIEGAKCIGIDLFDQESTPTPEVLDQYMAYIQSECAHPSSHKIPFPRYLCHLAESNRLPQFIRGNIALNHNLPRDIDLAYCKKLLVNLSGKEYEDTPSGDDGLLLGLKHIVQSLTPGGLLCAIEYDIDFGLGKYLEMCQLKILKQAKIKRREIRSRGRTKVISTFSLYLCRKP